MLDLQYLLELYLIPVVAKCQMNMDSTVFLRTKILEKNVTAPQNVGDTKSSLGLKW